MIDTFIGKTLAEKYRIDSMMRETELGKVYHGRHLLMDKPVAVKVLSPALAVDENIVKRFSSEARRVSHISHPGILNVTDFGSDAEGAVYIVFEDAEGETLKSTIERDGGFAPERAVRIAKQIAAALSAAHIKGVFHGNLNSENILLTGDEAVKILDLGAVKLDAVAAADDDFSFPKIEYLSPEQCADSGDADERSDIYSLGVILYEMLAGEVPFKAETTSELMMKHAQEPPPPLSAFRQDLPPSIEPLILQALAKNPEMRHQTAAELFDDLNRVERTLASSETTAAAAPASNSNLWKTAFVVLAGIALLSAALIWATSSKKTDPSTLQADSNSQPVQPINPATGMNEQGLATIVPITTEMLSNSNMTLTAPTDTLPGGDGYNPWGGSGPPIGAPPTGGSTVTLGDSNSQFMPPEGVQQGGQIVCGEDGKCFYIVGGSPSANANVKASSTPKTTKSPNANVVVQPTVEPNATPPTQTQPTPEAKTTPAKTPAAKPTPQPKNSPTSTKPAQSGKTQES